ncbi:MAG TPA: hypothetical protein VM243_05275 [Phycisphaerae bacterium]|nr:hypothetical protein [Phycisphaerae bacterium]
MRRILLASIVAVASVLLITTNTGCDNNIVSSNARAGFSSFLTGVISEAINKSGSD